MNKQSHLDRVWEVVGKVGVCMMTTHFADGLRARPLEARADRDENVIWFLSDRRGAKDDEIAAYPSICLTFIDPRKRFTCRFPGRHRLRAIQSVRRISGTKNSKRGGQKARVTPMFWSSRSGRKEPRFGTGRRVQPSRHMNLRKRARQAQSRISARTAKAR